MFKLRRASKFEGVPRDTNGTSRNSINPFKLLPVIHKSPPQCNDTAMLPYCNDTDVHNGPIKTPKTQTDVAVRNPRLPPIKTNVRFTPSISRFYNPFR